jgi:tripartite ATP-independent transporter DctM subunit
MIFLLLPIIFIVLMFIGVPIAFVIGITSLIGISAVPGITIITMPMKMFNGLNSFVLVAVPLFILAANIMNRGELSRKLIDFSVALVGTIRGGLALSNVLVSMLFAGISGASQADTAGIGKILIPNMMRTGYDDKMSVGVTAASSTIGVIIPPSIPMIIYAGLANISVGALFLAGIVPGILIGLIMMIVVYIISVRKGIPKYKTTSLKKIVKLFLNTLPALLTPVIIIGGIITGFFTATEAAAIATLYALLVGFFVYKTIKIRDLPLILTDTLKLSCLSLFALSTASALGELLGYFELGQLVERLFTTYMNQPILFLVIIVLFYLFIGTFMDSIPAMILFVPVVLPTALRLGIDPLHLGIVTVITLAIGLVTPPYGLCLLIASSIAKLPIEKSFKAVLPYISIELLVLLLIVFYPQLIIIFR